MKKASLFFKIFLPFLVLGAILVGGFSYYIYVTTRATVVERMVTSKQSYIKQTKNNLEQKVRTVEYAFNAYSNTSSFEQVFKSPMTEKEFKQFSEVNTQLNYISSMGMEGTSYSLISLEQAWKIRDGSLTHFDEAEGRRLREKYIEHQAQSIFWLRTKTGIQFANTLPMFSTAKYAIALAEIPNRTLDSIITSSEFDSPVVILDKQGQLMYGQESLFSADEIQLILAESEAADAGVIELGATKGQQVFFAKSDYNSWLYVTALAESDINSAIRTTKYGLLALTLILVILVALVSYVIAKTYTRPIRRIQDSLAIDGRGAIHHNEFESISHSIDSILNEKATLSTFITKEMPQLQTQFILNLFRNRMTEDELAVKMAQFQYSDDYQAYQVMLIQLDNLGNRDTTTKDIMLLTINKMVEEIIPANCRLLPIILNEETQGTILMFRSRDEQEIRKEVLHYSQLIMSEVKEHLKLSISIGLSSIYANLLESKRGCDLSKEALHYRLNLGKESIIFYEDISSLIQEPTLTQYPVELETRLFDAIRIGDEEQVVENLYPLLASIFKHNKNPVNFEIAIIRLVNDLIQLGQLLGTDVLTTEKNQALYHRVLSEYNPEEIERILVEQVIYPMVRGIKAKTSEQFKGISEKIIHIVRAEYDQDISLESIADRLHYNPNYLSSIFKKEYGINFGEFLMNYRLDMAKKWLVESDLTVKDIAEKLQYRNSQNFIRFFKKKVGTTPGDYRRAIRQTK
ncbi:helix-turn-helix domain-containing protein [Vagococcus sp. BWB3-3]|uniref:Helix-turn-helix domain-containing protein n=1 Tax=Vagococcus allomyrinae TaxID=2794353 RepID=A0A940PG22_9ENTE|nr:helix-turn-helix domain-containing protein [Vagococcus allomyrinae]MBP1043952.1 helix-turn-helix domain-containing protein [Vagococcus allomyrinae]